MFPLTPSRWLLLLMTLSPLVPYAAAQERPRMPEEVQKQLDAARKKAEDALKQAMRGQSPRQKEANWRPITLPGSIRDAAWVAAQQQWLFQEGQRQNSSQDLIASCLTQTRSVYLQFCTQTARELARVDTELRQLDEQKKLLADVGQQRGLDDLEKRRAKLQADREKALDGKKLRRHFDDWSRGSDPATTPAYGLLFADLTVEAPSAVADRLDRFAVAMTAIASRAAAESIKNAAMAEAKQVSTWSKALADGKVAEVQPELERRWQQVVTWETPAPVAALATQRTDPGSSAAADAVSQPPQSSAPAPEQLDPRLAEAMEHPISDEAYAALYRAVNTADDSIAGWAVRTQFAFWETVRNLRDMDLSIRKLTADRAEYERLGDSEGAKHLDRQIAEATRRLRTAPLASNHVRPEMAMLELFVDLEDPSRSLQARSKLSGLRGRLIGYGINHPSAPDRAEAERLVRAINEALARLDKKETAEADRLLAEEWRRVVMTDRAATAATDGPMAAGVAAPANVVVAWPVGIREKGARQRVEQMISMEETDLMRAWRLMQKQGYLSVFLERADAIRNHEASLQTLRGQLLTAQTFKDAREIARLEEGIARQEALLAEARQVTRSQITDRFQGGVFFLPSFAPTGGGDPQLIEPCINMLSGVRSQMRSMLKDAPKAQQDEGIWLADQADLIVAHLRAKRFAEADKVADEVVRWILSIDAPLEHEPGLPCFGRLEEPVTAAPR